MHDRESEQMQRTVFRAGRSRVFRFPIGPTLATRRAPKVRRNRNSDRISTALTRSCGASAPPQQALRTLLAKVHVDFQRERPKPPTGGARASSPHANRAKLRATQGHRLHWPPRRVHTRMSDRCARARAWADPTFPGRDRATMVHKTRSKSTNTSR